MSSRKEGWLKKQGHLLKNWKLRYFVLEDFMLSYYDNKQSLKKALGKLFMQGGTIETKGTSLLVKAKFGSKKYLYISASSAEELQEWSDAIQASIDSSVGVGIVKFSKALLDFGLKNQTAELAQPIYDDFEIVNLTAKKIKFKFEPMITKAYDLTFEPNEGVLPKCGRVPVKTKMIVNNPEIINAKAPLRVDADTVYLSFKCRGAGGVFGCDPATLPTETDSGFRVPSILVQMKRCLMANNALSCEGIFRLAGDAYDIKKVKESMNKNEFNLSSDVNTVASLIKIWFRELPTPILNVVPKEDLMNCGEKQISLDAYASLPALQKTLLDWLIELLLEFSANSIVNKMSLQNIAIVVAPNLYDPPDGNPMEGLILSQKCVQFFHHVMVWKKENQSKPAAPQRVVSTPRPAVPKRTTKSTPSRVLTSPAPPSRIPTSKSPAPAPKLTKQFSSSGSSLQAIQRPPPPTRPTHTKTTPTIPQKNIQKQAKAATISFQKQSPVNGTHNGYHDETHYNNSHYDQQGYEYEESYGYYDQGEYYSEQY